MSAISELRRHRFTRRAEKLVSKRECFEADTWNRVLDLSAELAKTPPPDEARLGEISAELASIARANIAVDFCFGVRRPDANAAYTASGLVTESSVGKLSFSEPVAEMREALDESDFFADGTRAATVL